MPSEIIKTLRVRLAGHLEILLLLGVVCGIAAFHHLLAATAAALFLILILRPLAVPVLVTAAAALVCCYWQTEWPANHYGHILAGRSRGATVIAQVNDSALVSRHAAGSDGKEAFAPPAMLNSQVLSIQLAGDAQMSDCHGELIWRQPPSGAVGVRYGDVVVMTGMMAVPEKDKGIVAMPENRVRRLPREFSDYLTARRVAAVFYAETVRVVRHEPGFTGRVILPVRDFLIRLMGSQMRHTGDAAALFWGCRGGLDGESGSIYVRSGTIHLFVVSGFHVGVAAGCLLLLLRGVPFRWRYALMPVLLLAYVVAAGSNVPAMRAWLMVGTWSVLRALLFRISALHLLIFFGAMFLLWNVDYRFDAGFIYSFVVTFFLLLLAEAAGRGKGEPNGDVCEIMPDKKSAVRKWRRKRNFLLMLAGAGVAFLASGAITMSNQIMWLPGSLPANILFMPLTVAMFFVAGLKICTGWLWSRWDWLLAALLDWSFDFMAEIAHFCAVAIGSSRVGEAAWPEVLLLLGGLTLLLCPVRRVWRWSGAAAVAGVLIVWHAAGWAASDAVAIIGGGGQELPCVVIADRNSGTGHMINVPSGEAAMHGIYFLRRHGIHRLESLSFSAYRAGAVRGLRALVRNMPPEVIYCPEKLPPGSRFFRQRLAEADGVLLKNTSLLKKDGKKSEFPIEYFNPGSNFTIRLNYCPERVAVSGEICGKAVRHEFGFSNIGEIVEYEK